MNPEYNGEIAPIVDAHQEIADAIYDEKLRMVEWAVTNNLSGYIAFVATEGDADPGCSSLGLDFILANRLGIGGVTALVRYLTGEVMEYTQHVDDLMSDG